VITRAGGRTLRTPRSGGPHACSGASCCVGSRAVLGTPKCEKSVGRRGSAPDPAGGAYSAPPDPLAGGEGLRGGFAAPLPKNPTYNIVIVFVMCVTVYVHTCMKMHCYFLLNVKYGASCMKMHCYFLLNVKYGASQLYLGVGPPTM